MVDPTTLLVKATPLKSLLEDVYKGAKGKIKEKIKKVTIDKEINSLYRNIEKVLKVKTIWKSDRPINLKEFYYPGRIVIDDEAKSVANLSIFKNENVTISGIAGQGKSIFLRYMCAQELRKSERIPVFVELKNISGKTGLFDLIELSLRSVGFDADEDLFGYLAKSGRLVLLLDAFDEIPESEVRDAVITIEGIASAYEDVQIVVTARPGHEIQNSRYFSNYEIAKLEEKDLPKIIKKLIKNQESVDVLMDELRKSKSGILGLLNTPLLVTLMVFVYQAEQKIPEHFSEFYEGLFPLLFHRHDKTKPGLRRTRRCQLNEREMESVFDSLSFITSKSQALAMPYSEALGYCDKAIKSLSVGVKAEDFLDDIVKVTCLLVDEGARITFIHRSVQEYHAARFVAHAPNDFAKRFYDKVRVSGIWSRWRQELEFLNSIDEYRFNKYFLLCDLSSSIEILENILRKQEPLGYLLDGSVVGFTEKNSLQRITSPKRLSPAPCALDELFVSLIRPLLDVFHEAEFMGKKKDLTLLIRKLKATSTRGIEESREFSLPFYFVAKGFGIQEHMLLVVQEYLSELIRRKKDALKEIEREEKLSSLLDEM